MPVPSKCQARCGAGIAENLDTTMLAWLGRYSDFPHKAAAPYIYVYIDRCMHTDVCTYFHVLSMHVLYLHIFDIICVVSCAKVL